MIKELTQHLSTGPHDIRNYKYEQLICMREGQNLWLLVVCLLEELEARADHRCAKLLHTVISGKLDKSFDISMGRRIQAVPGKNIAKDEKVYFYEDFGLIKIWQKINKPSCARCVELLAEADELWKRTDAQKITDLLKSLEINVPKVQIINRNRFSPIVSEKIKGVFTLMEDVIETKYMSRTHPTINYESKANPEDLTAKAVAKMCGMSICWAENCPSTLTPLESFISRGRLMTCKSFFQKLKDFPLAKNEISALYSFLIYIGAMRLIYYIEWFSREVLSMSGSFLIEFQVLQAYQKYTHRNQPLFAAALYGRAEVLEYLLEAAKEHTNGPKVIDRVLLKLRGLEIRVVGFAGSTYDITTENRKKMIKIIEKHFPDMRKEERVHSTKGEGAGHQDLIHHIQLRRKPPKLDSWEDL